MDAHGLVVPPRRCMLSRPLSPCPAPTSPQRTYEPGKKLTGKYDLSCAGRRFIGTDYRSLAALSGSPSSPIASPPPASPFAFVCDSPACGVRTVVQGSFRAVHYASGGASPVLRDRLSLRTALAVSACALAVPWAQPLALAEHCTVPRSCASLRLGNAPTATMAARKRGGPIA